MSRIILIVMLFAGISVNAQTEKGDWLVGGNFEFNTTSNNSSFRLSPNAGLFIARNLAIGGNLNVTYSKVGESSSGETKLTTLGAGPFVRYYFGEKQFRPFLYGDFNALYTVSKNPQGSQTFNGVSFLLGAGGAFFINPSVSLEGIAGYNNSSISGTSSGGFAFRLGFQVYLTQYEVPVRRGY